MKTISALRTYWLWDLHCRDVQSAWISRNFTSFTSFLSFALHVSKQGWKTVIWCDRTRISCFCVHISYLRFNTFYRYIFKFTTLIISNFPFVFHVSPKGPPRRSGDGHLGNVNPLTKMSEKRGENQVRLSSYSPPFFVVEQLYGFTSPFNPPRPTSSMFHCIYTFLSLSLSFYVYHSIFDTFFESVFWLSAFNFVKSFHVLFS